MVKSVDKDRDKNNDKDDNDSHYEDNLSEDGFGMGPVATPYDSDWEANGGGETGSDIINAGSCISIRSIDLHTVSAVLLALDELDQSRLRRLKLGHPVSLLNFLTWSKLLMLFFTAVLLFSLVLLCVETDKFFVNEELREDRWKLFVIEGFCTLVFTVEIVLQLLCLRVTSWSIVEENMVKWMRKVGIIRGFHFITFGRFHRVDSEHEGIGEGDLNGGGLVGGGGGGGRIEEGKIGFQKEQQNSEVASKRRKLAFFWNWGKRNRQQRGAIASDLVLKDSYDNDHDRSTRKVVRATAVEGGGITSWKWVLLDFIATAPFYILLISSIVAEAQESGQRSVSMEGVLNRMYSWQGVSEGFRILRMFRVLRLLKVIQKSEKLRVMIRALANSVD
ncbi:hypothetical protein HDU76_004794, partial [Blyttiomyces sp. JEL0837]